MQARKHSNHVSTEEYKTSKHAQYTIYQSRLRLSDSDESYFERELIENLKIYHKLYMNIDDFCVNSFKKYIRNFIWTLMIFV